MKELTQQELVALARDFYGNLVYSLWDIQDSSLVTSVFMILNFLDQETLDKWKDEPPGLIYEYLREAGPRSINGCPIFMSARFLTKGDADKLLKILQEMERTQNELEARLMVGG
jgi:hypothetical protein